jgi:hypothetical protein
VEGYMRRGYEGTSLGNEIMTFQMNILAPCSRVLWSDMRTSAGLAETATALCKILGDDTDSNDNTFLG